jgi:hypothetical protein
MIQLIGYLILAWIGFHIVRSLIARTGRGSGGPDNAVYVDSGGDSGGTGWFGGSSDSDSDDGGSDGGDGGGGDGGGD